MNKKPALSSWRFKGNLAVPSKLWWKNMPATHNPMAKLPLRDRGVTDIQTKRGFATNSELVAIIQERHFCVAFKVTKDGPWLVTQINMPDQKLNRAILESAEEDAWVVLTNNGKPVSMGGKPLLFEGVWSTHKINRRVLECLGGEYAVRTEIANMRSVPCPPKYR